MLNNHHSEYYNPQIENHRLIEDLCNSFPESRSHFASQYNSLPEHYSYPANSYSLFQECYSDPVDLNNPLPNYYSH